MIIRKFLVRRLLYWKMIEKDEKGYVEFSLVNRKIVFDYWKFILSLFQYLTKFIWLVAFVSL